MASKKGDKYECEDCGLVVLIEEPCGCEPCEIVCCGQPMKPAKAVKAESKGKARLKRKTK